MKKIEVHTSNTTFDITMRVLTLISGIIVAIVLISQFNQTNKQIEIQEKGKSADRFRDGIELLGSPNDAIVIGGIYLLDNLAHEYPDEYAVQVFEIFCGYLRTDSKLNWKEHRQIYSDSSIIDSLILSQYIFPNKYQTIIDKVFKDSTQFFLNSIGKNYKIDLRGACFVNADLSKVNFIGANLESSNMCWSSLDSSNLESANLRFAELIESNLSNAILVCADMSGAKLQGAYLSRTQMQGVRLDVTSMEGAFLMLANLEGAFLVSTHLEGSFISLSNFNGACLSGVHFDGAIISGSSFKGTSSEPGAVEMFLLEKERSKYGDENKLYLNGACEFADSKFLLEYLGGHKLVFIKHRSGKPSFIIPKNQTQLHFGLLNEADIDSVKTKLVRLSVSKKNQEYVMWLINHHNDAKENMKEMFIEGRGILTYEDAAMIINRVDKELGNY